jgi:ABC-2 type transport system ATP-binding protein
VIIRVQNLSHSYGDKPALADVSFGVELGALFSVLGPNGCGKSTLFRILATLTLPKSGTASVNGHDIQAAPDAVRKSIGVVFQTSTADKKMTVEENLNASAHLYGLSGTDASARIRTGMEEFQLAERRNDEAGTLSGGYLRRLEIARALLHRPAVLLLDEASTGLDPIARRELSQTIDRVRRDDGVTVVMTTHLMEEADRSDRILLLHEGRIVREGTPLELKASIGGDVVMVSETEGADLAKIIFERFGIEAQRFGDELRVETASGHHFLAALMDAAPGAVASAGLHKPTLEDVFLRETGARLDV